MRGHLVHAGDERGGAAFRRARQHARRGVVGGDEREVQQVCVADELVRLEIGHRGVREVRPGHGDLLREIRIVGHERDGRHDLGQAGDRPLVVGVLFPEDSSGLRVEDDGGGGADVGNHVPELVALEARGHGLALNPFGGGPRPGRGASPCRGACPRQTGTRLRRFGGLLADGGLGFLRGGWGGSRLRGRSEGRHAGDHQQCCAQNRHTSGKPRQRHVYSSTRGGAARNLLPFSTNRTETGGKV